MNKILSYSLGVLACLGVNVAYAVDKFEILPDLPDTLNYAVPSAEASTITGTTEVLSASQSVGHEPSIISVVFSLLFVILLIYITGILYTKLNKVGYSTLKKQQGDFAKSQVSVVSTTQLGNNKTLHVVELDGKRMLIGASSSAIQLIKDLGSISSEDGDEEYSRIEIPNIKIPKIEIPKIEIPSIGFSKIITKTHKNWLKEENQEDKKDQSSIIEEKSVVEDILDDNANASVNVNNSEGIIDSLFTSEVREEVQEDIVDKNEHKVDPDEYALYKKYLG